MARAPSFAIDFLKDPMQDIPHLFSVYRHLVERPDQADRKGYGGCRPLGSSRNSTTRGAEAIGRQFKGQRGICFSKRDQHAGSSGISFGFEHPKVTFVGGGGKIATNQRKTQNVRGSPQNPRVRNKICQEQRNKIPSLQPFCSCKNKLLSPIIRSSALRSAGHLKQ